MNAVSTEVNVRHLERGDVDRWDAFVRNNPQATFFHLAGWQRVIERSFGHRTYYLMAERNDEIIGVLPLTHIKSRLFGNALISNSFCVYGGPATSDDAGRNALDRAAIELMERTGVPVLEFRTILRDRPDWPCKDNLYVTFRKSIGSDLADNMKAIPRKQRAMIRKGIQNNLRSEIDQNVNRLHAVYSESVRNLGTPVFSKSYFRILKEEFGDACDVVTVVKDSEPVASVLNFYFRGEVLPYYGGGTAAARRLAGNDFLYWEVMRRACERGCTLFDFGRSKVGTGSYAFKKNWGFDSTQLSYQYHLANGYGIPNVSPQNPKYGTFVRAWKRLPLPLANLLGPRLARDLG